MQRFKRFMGFQPSSLDNWIFKCSTYVMDKRYKNSGQIHLHPKRPHTKTNMNDNINMDSTIAWSVNARI